MDNGILVISLDFEMLWGAIFNEAVEEGYRYRVPYVELIVPKLLSLFEKYSIHATWAVVGGIACADKKTAGQHAPQNVCNPYKNQSLVDFINSIKENEENLYFRPDLVRSISRVYGQEIATHTFSHFYYDEHTNPKVKLKEEINISKSILEKISGEKIESIVLPKNQVRKDAYPIMLENGISIIRGDLISKRFNKNNILRRYLRFLDAYIPVCGHSSYPISQIYHDGIYDVRASTFWRTYYSKLAMFEKMKIWRIKSEMTYAAKRGEVYHIWFHPHNLSSDYERNLKSMEDILKHYIYLKKKYGMKTLNMKECAGLVHSC